MEELHHIHKEVPFGYWVLWVEPAFRVLRRKWREARDDIRRPSVRWQLLRWG
ncbi:MAG TPA: hypothetical protein VGC92_16020 [Phenylobacterium sp.]|jgi:hypothetical protein